MTGNDGYTPHHSDPNRPQQPAPWPATGLNPQAQWSPQPSGPWGPGAPPWAPPAAKRGRRAALIIGATAIVVAAVATAVVVVSQQPISVSAPTTAIPSSLPANATPQAAFYMLADPSVALPTVDEIKQITLLDLAPNGAAPMTQPRADHATAPPNCSLVTSATSKTVWGDASQIGGQQFTDKAGNTAWAGLAFWDSADGAAASLTKLTTAIQSCPPQFVLTGEQGADDTKWTVSDVHVGDHRISWTTTPQDQLWKCSKDYRVKVNVAVTATLCTPNPSTSAARIDDLVMDKATTKH